MSLEDSKNLRRRRFQQKERNHRKWEKRIKGKGPISYPKNWSPEDFDRTIGMHANHGKLCSCSGCGNPRRYQSSDSLTRQEKKFYSEPTDE